MNPGGGKQMVFGYEEEKQMVFGYREPFPIDVVDEGNYYLVQAALSGVRPEDISVDVDGQTLVIRGERRDEEQHQGRRWIACEQHTGVLERSFTLPTAIKEDQIKACCEYGVVMLMIPKADEALPQRAKTDTRTPVPAAPSGRAVSRGALPRDEADAVLEASLESFPASDSPSWNPQ
jgi:HSP20 family protein